MKSCSKDKKKTRIGLVDENTLGYYRRVSNALDDGFENDEEKSLFVRNVFGQLLKEAGRVSRNQTISKIVEKLLEHADASQCSALVGAFLDAAGDDASWTVLCKDRFASHVLQAAVARMSKYVAAGDKAAVASLRRLCSAVSEAGSELATDTYASHVVRVAIEVAGGVEVAESLIRSRLSRENPRKILFPFFEHSSYNDFNKLFKSLSTKLFPGDRNAILALAKDASANPVMQTMLAVVRLKDRQLGADICRRLLVTGNLMDRADGSLPAVLTNEIASYLFEAVLSAADDDLYAQLFESHIKRRVTDLAAHPVANFTLQRALSTVRTEEQFRAISRKLSAYLEEVLACGHMGVVVRLFEASHKYAKRQRKLVKCLLKAFHCYSPESRLSKAAQLIMQLSTYEAFVGEGDHGEVDSGAAEDLSKKEKEAVAAGDRAANQVSMLQTVTYQGSLLLQQLLRLEAPGASAPFISSILSMHTLELRTVCCSPCGSHVLDAFLSSPTVLANHKAELWKKLQPFCADLCCDKHGSRVMDRLWSGASKRLKEELAAIAGAAVRRLMGNPYGRILCSNFAVNDFLHRRRDWDAAQAAGKRKALSGGSKPTGGGDAKKQKPPTAKQCT